jgi:probable selenium-dependent hydroxylase accessory protein YqeC
MVSLFEALDLTKGGVISLVGAGGKTSLLFRLASELAAAGESVLTTTTTKIMMPAPNQSSQVILTKSPDAVLAHARKVLIKNHHIFAASTRIADFPEKLSGFPPGAIDKIWSAGLLRWVIVEADGAARRPLKVPADHEPVIPLSSKYIIGVIGLKVLGKPVGEDWVFRHERFSKITGLMHGELVTEASVVNAVMHEKGLFKSASHAKKILFLNAAESPWGPAIEKIVVGRPLEDPAVIGRFDISP